MADRNIKGITVEIGGDTTGLDKALKDTETNSKKAASELRSINKALENAVLWQQKQVVLNKALEESKKKLEILQTSQKSLSQKLADGDIDKAQYDKFQEKLEKSRKNLDELNKSQADMKRQFDSGEIDKNAYEKFQEKIKKAEKAVKDLENAERSMEEKVKAGDISEDQYRAFQRELERSKSEVSKLETQVESVNQEVENLGRVSDDAAEEVQELGKSADDTAEEVKQLGESAEDAGNKAENSSDGFTVMKGAVANLVSEGISKAVEGFKELATEGDAAINTLQTRTGATAEQMEEYKDIIDSLYADNMGEDRIDIADSIAEVKQQLVDIDASSLEEVTNTALLMRDTFDFEVNESVRAVNMLMKQFGITADEAYTLIAQGAQNGLNKNGDLLDVINEYGVHYNQLGYSAEEFFNSLQNGTESGTFSVDKLGDAMKEFGIRVRDTADSTTEGFTLIGLDADIMRSKFAKGGESAKEAAQQTVNALFSVNDKIVQNQAGVALFGTMWEDMGADAVKALMDTNGEADKTKSTLQDIAEVKYDDLGSQFQQVGRQAKTEILEPIAEDFLPEMKKAVDWVARNLPEIKSLVKGIAAEFAIFKGAQFLSGGIDKVNKFTSALKAGESAATLLGGSLTSKFMLAANAAAILGTAIYKMYTEGTTASEDAHEQLEKYKEKCEEASKELDGIKKSAYEATDAEMAQTDRTKDLWNELQKLADSSGNVKKKDEERAKYIIGELKEATGINIGYIDGQIQKYGELCGQIDKAIEKRRADVILSAYESKSGEVRSNAEEAKNDYIEKRQHYNSLSNPQTEEEKAFRDQEFLKAYGVDYSAASAAQLEDFNKTIDYAEQEMNLAKDNYNQSAEYLGNLEAAYDSYEKGQYDRVDSLVTYQESADEKIVKNTENGLDEREKAFQRMLDTSLAELQLANQSGSQQLKQSTAESMVHLVEAYTDGGFDSAIGFSTEFIEEMKKALADGVNFDSFIEAVGDSLKGTGKTIGEILGSEAAARYQEIISERMTLHTQQLYANNNLIQKTINSQSDANLYGKGYIKGDYGTPKMATGGILNYGKAIVAEAGPELLQLTNQGVQVTPLTQTARNHALSSISGGGDTYNQHITVNVQKISSDYDVRRIAQQMANELKRTRRGGGK